jgi:hypothetical protein
LDAERQNRHSNGHRGDKKKGENMEKKKSWKRRVLKISLIVFGVVILTSDRFCFTFPKILFRAPEKIELTEYNPFISAEAKKQCLTFLDEWSKLNI